jgi:hypothetical protein
VSLRLFFERIRSNFGAMCYSSTYTTVGSYDIRYSQLYSIPHSQHEPRNTVIAAAEEIYHIYIDGFVPDRPISHVQISLLQHCLSSDLR